MPDPFEILGVPSSASTAEIQAAYRRLAFLYHPDRLEGAPIEVRAEAKRRMIELTRAHQDTMGTEAELQVLYGTAGWTNRQRADLTMRLLDAKSPTNGTEQICGSTVCTSNSSTKSLLADPLSAGI